MNPSVHSGETEEMPQEDPIGGGGSNPISQLSNLNPRLKVFFILYPTLLIILLGSMGWRQLIQQGDYEKRGELQSRRRVLHPGPRGDIFDREGKLLVGNRPRYSAVVYLDDLRRDFRRAYFDKVREKRREAARRGEKPKFKSSTLRSKARAEVLQTYIDQVNAITGRNEQVDMKDMVRHFRQRLLLPLTLVEDLSPREYAMVIEQIPVNSPIRIFTGSARYYPYHTAAAHTLGYVGRTRELDEEGLEGDELSTVNFEGKLPRAGLEKSLDDTLRGETGNTILIVDPVGYRYKPIKDLSKAPVRGESVTTSLDVELQQIAEKSLEGRTGAVVAIEIEKGEILALASRPYYDLNNFSPTISRATYDDVQARKAWINHTMQGRYPPGSTFKIITAIAGMRTGTLDPDEEIECGAFLRIGNRNFPEHGHQSFGWVNLPYALQVSSNVYCYQEGLEMGVDALAQEARRFGLNQKTQVELPGEFRGVVPDAEWKMKKIMEPWVSGDTANMSIGQGYLLTTPLQMCAFTASLARRETRTDVTLVKRDEFENVQHGGEPIGLTNYQYEKIIEGMRRAAGPNGTARRIMIDGLNIAAKTGTAEHRDGGKKLWLAWVIAFAPVEDPELAVAVMVVGAGENDLLYGGATAAPIARNVFDFYFSKSGYFDTGVGL